MPGYVPEQFWSRFRALTERDLPVILQTGIKQSTLSTWHTENTYHSVDDTVKIAAVLQTTVEYLVTGSAKARSPLNPAAKLSLKGQQTLKYFAPLLVYISKETKMNKLLGTR
jgi:transcriptional regulator with XRE-family HTH domain